MHPYTGQLKRAIPLAYTHYITAMHITIERTAKFKHVYQVAWQPSDLTEYKLNTDGASSSNTGMAGTGALVRDRSGKLVVALAANIGLATNVLAELWAIRDGIIMAQKKNIRKLHIENDSYTVLQMLRRDPMELQIRQEMVKDIRALIWEFEASYEN